MTPDPSASSDSSDTVLKALGDLLQRRLAVIADHELRTQDPAAQMEELRRVSEQISLVHEQHRADLPPRLNHFIERASFQKALEYIEGGGAE